MQEGGLIELTSGPNGGMNYADGWWEGASVHSYNRGKRYEHATRVYVGVDTNGRKGIFPSNYVGAVFVCANAELKVCFRLNS